MNRTQYRRARRIYRDNGRAALRWLSADAAACMVACAFTYETDPLAFRVWIVSHFGMKGAHADIRFYARNITL
jgi:hypothetical protein